MKEFSFEIKTDEEHKAALLLIDSMMNKSDQTSLSGAVEGVVFQYLVALVEEYERKKYR